MTRDPILIGGLLVVLFLAAACKTQGQFPRAPYGPVSGTVAYKEGWRYGCWAGLDSGGWTQYRVYAQLRNESRYAGEADYNAGYDDGLDNCYEWALNRPEPLGGFEPQLENRFKGPAMGGGGAGGGGRGFSIDK